MDGRCRLLLQLQPDENADCSVRMKQDVPALPPAERRCVATINLQQAADAVAKFSHYAHALHIVVTTGTIHSLRTCNRIKLARQ